MTILVGSTWDHPRGFAPLVGCSALYAERTGVDIRWSRRSLQAFADRPLSLLAKDNDLIVIDHPHLGEAVAEGSLLPFNRSNWRPELSSLAEASIGASFESYFMAGRQWALPIDAAAQVAAYRPDRIDNPPSTWEDVIRLAQAGAVLFPLKPVDAIDSFLTLCANLGAPLPVDGSWINRTIAAAAFDAIQAVARHVPACCLDYDPVATLEMLSGDGPFTYAPLLFGYNNFARQGFREHRLAFGDIPALGDIGCAGSILGGAGLAISANCREPEVAADFAFWITGGAVQSGSYFSYDGQPAHAAAWNDEAVNAAAGDFFRDTRATMDAAWLRPRNAGFLDFADLAGDILNAALRGHIARGAALDALERAHGRGCEPRSRCYA